MVVGVVVVVGGGGVGVGVAVVVIVVVAVAVAVGGGSGVGVDKRIWVQHMQRYVEHRPLFWPSSGAHQLWQRSSCLSKF